MSEGNAREFWRSIWKAGWSPQWREKIGLADAGWVHTYWLPARVLPQLHVAMSDIRCMIQDLGSRYLRLRVTLAPSLYPIYACLRQVDVAAGKAARWMVRRLKDGELVIRAVPPGHKATLPLAEEVVLGMLGLSFDRVILTLTLTVALDCDPTPTSLSFSFALLSAFHYSSPLLTPSHS